MRLPDCLICGAQKGGTRALISYLSQHPKIFTYPHELNFFSMQYNKGINWYSKKFRKAKPNQLIIEKSPQYMYFYEAPRRIKEKLPDVKLIFILRDPVKRAYSHYWMNVLKGKEKKDFSEVIRYSIRQPEPCIHNYISRGFYDEQLERYKKLFDKSQMLILQSYDLRHKTQETLNIVCDFLETEHFIYKPIKTKVGSVPKYTFLSRILSMKHINCFPTAKAVIQKLNKGDPYPPMKDEDKKYLEEIYDETKSKMYMAFKQKL
jgi:hypothetical protein